jgi:hypothetical protein
MFDELDRLREAAELHTLLTQYADLAGPDRQVWQDRRMALEGCGRRDLTKLHGELIAYGWIEQNTGVVPVARLDEAPGCYRVTPAGLRALKQVLVEE